MSDFVIKPEDAMPIIDYTLTELDGVVHSTQERVCKGRWSYRQVIQADA